MSARHKHSEGKIDVAVPAHLDAYVAVLGVDRTIEFLLEFGGAAFYLAADPKGKSEVAAWLGLELATELVAMLRSRQFHSYARVPTAKPWIASILRARGWKIGAIARKLHVTDVTVSGWLRKDRRQLELF